MTAERVTYIAPGPVRTTALLSRDDVARLVSVPDAVHAVREVFRAHGQGRVAMPAKISLDLRPFGLNAWHNAMPGYIEPAAAAGIKWAGGYADNPARHGLPYVMALIVLQDPETGYPLAIMDGVHITNIRTGAVVGVAAEYYARSEAGVAAFVGAGAQAVTALEALVLTRRPTSITVYDLDPGRAASFAVTATRRHGLAGRACGTVEEAVTGAWLITTATPADAPLVEGRWIAPGATSVSLGSFQEFSDDAVEDAERIVVDSWEQCAHRGELKRFADSGRLTRADIYGEIGDTVGGDLPGRDGPDQRILVVPIGLGTHDLYLARMVLDRASAADLRNFDFVNVQ